MWLNCLKATATLRRQLTFINLLVQVLWYTFQKDRHINQYFIPTRWINSTVLWAAIRTKKCQPKYYHSKYLDITNLLADNFACQKYWIVGFKYLSTHPRTPTNSKQKMPTKILPQYLDITNLFPDNFRLPEILDC